MHKIESMEQLGVIIRQSRKKQGLTQSQLAAISGVGIRFIREAEQGKESCYIGKVLHVLTMLGHPLYVEEAK